MPPKQIINYKKLELVTTVVPDSPLQALEDLMVFDARCLDRETWRQLLRVLPNLTRIRKAWKAHFVAFGCLTCKRKKVQYGAGGLCYTCLARTTGRMRRCFRQIDVGRQDDESFRNSLCLSFNAAQRLFNSEELP